MTPYYEQGGITIYHGDFRDLVAGLEFDVVLTDPPYGTGQKISYDVYRDTLPEWQAMIGPLIEITTPMAFTMSHTRLFDLPRRPQWIGCWDKVFTGGITHVGASPSWEPVCFYNLPPGDRGGAARWDDVFRFPVAGFPFQHGRDPNGHPCPKPVALYKRLIRILPAGVILDPMMGSGTTLRAAKDVRRAAIGIDVSERYCEIAATRLQQGVLALDEVVG
jgi:site-specific DNA-methyltransferase (adenine-specific)